MISEEGGGVEINEIHLEKIYGGKEIKYDYLAI